MVGTAGRVRGPAAWTDPLTATARVVTSTLVSLTKGAQRINVDYFDYTDDDSLLVEYKGPDTNNAWAKITISALKSAENIVTAVEDEQDPIHQLIVNVYPNPTTPSNINVEIRSGLPGSYAIQMFDQLGKSVFSETIPQMDDNTLRLTDDQVLSPGLYYLKVSQGKQTVTRRVVIKP